MRSHRRTSRGFSLIEILVVLTIVAILVALFLPPLVKAKRQTLKTVCKAYAYQIGRVSRGEEARLKLEALNCGCYGAIGGGDPIFTIPAGMSEDDFRKQLQEEMATARH